MHNFRFHGSGHENKPTVYETTWRTTSHVGVTKSGQLFRAPRKYFAKLPGQWQWRPTSPPTIELWACPRGMAEKTNNRT